MSEKDLFLISFPPNKDLCNALVCLLLSLLMPSNGAFKPIIALNADENHVSYIVVLSSRLLRYT